MSTAENLTDDQRSRLKAFKEFLIKRQDQHFAFFSTLESIRWKFLSVFGIAAAIALAVATESGVMGVKNIIAFVLAVIVSAGLGGHCKSGHRGSPQNRP